MKIYSTILKNKEIVRSKNGKKLNVFVCGITTYDFSHIGHARTYIAFDMIVKYLRSAGYSVYYLQNITDMDDKIIQRANENNEDVLKLSRRFEAEYLADMKTLGINAVSKYARATKYIKEIISQVERLLQKSYAYEIKDDGIYFDILQFKEYGKLSGRSTAQAQDAVSRIDESVHKRNKGDFAVWKFVSESEQKAGVPAWESPWGKGRPGWHIEDTAITEKFFGPQYDIHGGAIDLIFPHHEAEITQMESISGKSPLVRYWMHTGFLTVKGEKMSKSLGNFITIRDFLKNHSPRLLRLFILKKHYTSPIDYSEELLQETQNQLDRIDEFVERLTSITLIGKSTNEAQTLIASGQAGITGAMEDDFNTPILIAVIFELIRKGNILADAEKINRRDARRILTFFKEIDQYFGFLLHEKKQAIPAAIRVLVKEREQYRTEKNWAQADRVRSELQAKGWMVDDTPLGQKITKIDKT